MAQTAPRTPPGGQPVDASVEGCRACTAARRWSSTSGIILWPSSSSCSSFSSAPSCDVSASRRSVEPCTDLTSTPRSSDRPVLPRPCHSTAGVVNARPFSTTRHPSSWFRSALLVLLCAVVLDVLPVAKAKVCEVPRFTKLPPPIVYRSQYPAKMPTFTCSAFPTSSRVVFLERTSGSKLSPTVFSTVESRGTATHTFKSNELHQTVGKDYFCRVSTDFGFLMSRPFRLVLATISSYSESEPSSTVSFYKGNIAQVQCSIPTSQPAATVQFLKDGVIVGHSDKYLEVRLPHATWVALLIKEFSSADVGNYSCKARNPASLQETEGKATTKLTLQKASSAFKVRFHKKFPYGRSSHHHVTVREGENVTLYCLPEGAPIPSVQWIRQSGTDGRLPSEAKLFPDFGAIRIENVKPEHASTYSCSVSQGDRMINKAFELRVIERLKIRVAPQDQIVEKLGSEAKLSCQASGGEGEINTEWFFNAQPIMPHRDAIFKLEVTTVGYGITRSELTIQSVTTDLLGIYQCVARTNKEWTSAAAAVYMKGDELRRGETRQPHRVVNSPVGTTAMLMCALMAEEQNKYDVKWFKGTKQINPKGKLERFMANSIPPHTYMNVLMTRVSDSGLYVCRFYEKNTNRLVKEDYVRLRVSEKPDPISKERERSGPQPKPEPDWSKPNPTETKPMPPDNARRIEKPKKKSDLSRPIAIAVFDNLAVEIKWNYTGEDPVEYYNIICKRKNLQPTDISRDIVWSEPIEIRTRYHGNNYIITDDHGVPSSQENNPRHLRNGTLLPNYAYKFRILAFLTTGERKRSSWSHEIDFSHILKNGPTLLKALVISPTKVRVVWQYVSEVGELDQFVIGYREQIDRKVNGYQTELVEDGRKREFEVTGLRPDTAYQFMVYGIMKPRVLEQRRVTRLSNVKYVHTMPISPAEKAMNNKWTFLIMGCLAALLIVVVAILMCACLWKQKKEKRRMRASALQAALHGTSIDSNYKDPKFLVPGTNSASSQLLLSNLGDGTAWHQHLHGGQPPPPTSRHNPASNGGLRLNVNPEAASLMMNYDERIAALPPPPPPGPYFGNGTLRRESNSGRLGYAGKKDFDSHYATRNMEDPLYATRLHPAYAVTSPVGSIYPLPSLPAPLGGPPGHFSPYAVALPPLHANGDGTESVYSYFSQQETATQHNDVPTPYAASRTVDRPKHHRRKRRRPTNPANCSQSGMESGSETGAPHMKDMAVNTDMSSSDAIYESSIQASTTASPPPRMGALMMGGLTGIPGGLVSTPSAYKSPPGGPEIHPPPPPAHPVASLAALSTPLTSVASSSPSSSSGAPSSHTLTRRGTPNLFLDPPRVRDYTEYGVAVSPDPNSKAGANTMVPAV